MNNLNLIKQFKELFNFEKDVDQDCLALYLNEETKEQCKHMQWLYVCLEENVCLVGIEGFEIFAINSEGFLVSVCDEIQNIPYELLREQARYAEDGLVQDVFKYNQDFLHNLLKYEEFCEKNNIVLDKQKVYHDVGGELFTQYFEK